MANNQFFSTFKYPLTAKPLTRPDDKLTYDDIFNLQNSLRLLIHQLDSAVEGLLVDAPDDGTKYVRKDRSWVPESVGEAPEDGKQYGRLNKTWVEITGGGSGGGSSMKAIQGIPTGSDLAGTIQANTLESPATLYGYFDTPSSVMVLGADGINKNAVSDFIDVPVNIRRGTSRLLLIAASEGATATFDVDSAVETTLNCSFDHIQTIQESIASGTRNITVSIWETAVPQSSPEGSVHIEFTENSTYGTVAAVICLSSTTSTIIQDSIEIKEAVNGVATITFDPVDFPKGTTRLYIAVNATNSAPAAPTGGKSLVAVGSSLSSRSTRLSIWELQTAKVAFSGAYSTGKTLSHVGIALFCGIAPNPKNNWALFHLGA